jgi:N-acetylneuraminic acid mutarotase
VHSSRSVHRKRRHAPALLVIIVLLACLPAAANADSWTTVQPLTTGRSQHTATLLPNGQVLVAGGNAGAMYPVMTASSERYDPASGTWLTTPSFSDERYEQGASLLPDGRVLMTGGYYGTYLKDPAVLASVRVYDPATNSWSGAADMPRPHGLHAQLTLPDGRVFVFGGYASVADAQNDAADDHVDLYDPATNAWTIGTTAPYYMANGTATLLSNGSVLIAGGSSSNTNRNVAMKYNPATNKWTTSGGSFTDARKYHTATLLQNGKVLIAGGFGDGGTPLRTASLYDPATNTWSEVVPMATARASATATLLPNGKVLVAGGSGASGPLASAELFDPATNTWSPAASMAIGRRRHTATLLADGRVLVAGGGGTDPETGYSKANLDSAEIYTPDGWPFPAGGGSGGGTGGGSGGGTGGAGASGTPSISSLALSASRFRAARSGPAATAARRRAPIGTTISWRDGATATATFVMQRPANGRISGGRCVKATRANRSHRRCTRWSTVGRFTHADAAGPNRLRLTGRVRGRKLARGRYRLSVTARVGRDSASAAARIAFRIVG